MSWLFNNPIYNYTDQPPILVFLVPAVLLSPIVLILKMVKMPADTKIIMLYVGQYVGPLLASFMGACVVVYAYDRETWQIYKANRLFMDQLVTAPPVLPIWYDAIIYVLIAMEIIAFVWGWAAAKVSTLDKAWVFAFATSLVAGAITDGFARTVGGSSWWKANSVSLLILELLTVTGLIIGAKNVFRWRRLRLLRQS